MRRRLRGLPSSASLAAGVWLGAAALWGGLLEYRARAGGDRFDFVVWEAQAVPNRLLFDLGRPLRADVPADAALARYFALTDRSGDEARRLENVVEREIERRVAAVLRQEGLGWLFPGVMPPVDIELASSPRVLVTSPRDRIERIGAEPLRPDLTRDRVQALEADAERDGRHSALVVASGGIATFPAIVVPGGDYESTVSTAAHEWLHHYLAAFPLGMAYFADSEAQTINETVADIFGDAVAATVIERFGQPGAPVPAAAVPPGRAEVDLAAVLRDLRVRVDALLAGGRVQEAERAMEETRRGLAERGVHIRRINQAYFAWFGTYAARPESVDPLGGQLRAVLAGAGSLRVFVERIRSARTRSDIAGIAEAYRQAR